MTLFEFSATADLQGNHYVAGQVIAFDDGVDVSTLPGQVVQSAAVFSEHVDRSEPAAAQE